MSDFASNLEEAAKIIGLPEDNEAVRLLAIDLLYREARQEKLKAKARQEELMANARQEKLMANARQEKLEAKLKASKLEILIMKGFVTHRGVLGSFLIKPSSSFFLKISGT